MAATEAMAEPITAIQLGELIDAPAYIHDDEMACLRKYARRAEKVIVEIGTGYGASATLLLSASGPDVRVYSIDAFVPDSHGGWTSSIDRVMDSIINAITKLHRLDMALRFTLLAEPCEKVVRKWVRPIDLLYIDGDHQYDAVRRDFEDWIPFVKKGGFIILHDSRRIVPAPTGKHARGWPGPTQLASELGGDRRVRLVDAVYSMTVWEVIRTKEEK